MHYDNRNLFLHISGGQESEIKVSAGLIPFGGSEGETLPFMPLPWLLVAASSPWLPLAHGLILPIPHCIFPVSFPVSCKDMLIGFRALMTQYSLTSILTTVKSAKTPIFK